MLEQLFKWIPDSRSWLVHNKSSVDVTLITTGHIGNCEQNCHKHYPFKKKKKRCPKRWTNQIWVRIWILWKIPFCCNTIEAFILCCSKWWSCTKDHPSPRTFFWAFFVQKVVVHRILYCNVFVKLLLKWLGIKVSRKKMLILS